MSRWLAAHSEVVGRADEAAAEMILPDAVDHHAGGKWVVWPGEPASEFEPAAALGAFGQCAAAEGSDETTRCFLTGPVRLAAHLESRVVRGAFHHAVGHVARAFDEQGLKLIRVFRHISTEHGELLPQVRHPGAARFSLSLRLRRRLSIE